MNNERLIPQITTVLSENVPRDIQVPNAQSEQEPICGSTSNNVPIQQAGPASSVSDILNNGKWISLIEFIRHRNIS